MFWTIIVSIILKKQLKKAGHGAQYPVKNTEHTPGFYEVDAVRLMEYASVMDRKLRSAISRHQDANQTISRAARLGKSQPIQTRFFFRQETCENRVLRARSLVANAKDDLNATIAAKAEATKIVDLAYELAYRRKLDLLKQNLLGAGAK